MSAPDEHAVDFFVAQLADGADIDWQLARSELSEALLERLIRLDRLVRTLRAGPAKNVATTLPERSSWGHLLVHESLGRGQYGEVFRAFDPVLQRDVALKLSLDDKVHGDPQSWIAEARRLARVRHPNVLAVHGADVHDSVPGLWADRVQGESLAVYLATHTPSRAQRLQLQLSLAEAVRAVHDQGLAHGDIKPANVLIDNNERPILMDFGAARELKDNASTGQLIGTPLFMAPERLAGGPASSAADVFALGAVIVFMNTGRAPFDADSFEALQKQHELDQTAWSRHPAMSRSDRQLLTAMLHRNPERRPGMNEVIERIERMHSAPERRRRVSAVATIMLLLMGGLATA
ncbi:MAG: serine/threonine-protein kinase, partial [Pseudomonadota bacterium]